MLQILPDQRLTGAFNLLELQPEATLNRFLDISLAWWIGRIVYASRVEARMLSRAGRELLEIGLLDTRSAAPLVRHGMRSALLAPGLLSLGALMLYDWEAAPALLMALANMLRAGSRNAEGRSSGRWPLYTVAQA